jgi:hypothetical protein
MTTARILVAALMLPVLILIALTAAVAAIAHCLQ